MFSQLRPAVVCFVLLTFVTGVVYPAVVTVFAKAFFNAKAEGSLIVRDDKVVGSELIAQGFTGARYFWPRPSAAGYNGAGASGSNLGPRNPALVDAVKPRIEALKQADLTDTRSIPVELVTASASGLDPHLSPAAVEYQIHRVATARGLDEATVRAAVERHTSSRAFGLLGEPTVNVLLVNLDLDHASAPSKSTASTLRESQAPGYRAYGFLPESR